MKPKPSWRRNICRNTIGGFGEPRGNRSIIITEAGRTRRRAGGGFPSGKRRTRGNDWVIRHDNRQLPGASSIPTVCAGQGQSHGVRMGRRALADSLSRSGCELGGDSRPSSSSGCNPRGGHGPLKAHGKAAHAQKRITPFPSGDHRKMRPGASPPGHRLSRVLGLLEMSDSFFFREYKAQEAGLLAGAGEKITVVTSSRKWMFEIGRKRREEEKS